MSLKYCSNKSPKIHVSVQNEDENWLFKVKDNGIGIETERILSKSLRYLEGCMIVMNIMEQALVWPSLNG